MASQSSNAPQLAPRRAICFSRGIRALRHIEAFLQIDELITPAQADTDLSGVESVVVWGRKSNSAAAIEYARSRNLPVVYLEDGWLRTSSLNAHSRNCYSLLVDRSGVYYDAGAPSDIENMLNLPDREFDLIASADALQYARQCLDQLVANNITKYNYCSSAQDELIRDKSLVLVVDQTFGDASIMYGGMDAERFADMLECACRENPQAEIVVRTHPDVVSGKKQGYLHELAVRKGLTVSSGGTNPLGLVKQASKVYVGTSQLGYEALLCGAAVSVFGKPFYAGWGLTEDRQALTRRVQNRSIEQLFFTSHVLLPRYINPATGEQWQLHNCLDHIQLQQHYFSQNAKRFACHGITHWKRRYMEQFLRSPDGDVQFGDTANADCNLSWSFRSFDRPQNASELPVVRVEDGFIRSTGLGSDFNAPASLVVDQRGLYFDPSQESDLEHLLNKRDCSVAEISRAVRLKRLILSAGLSKYNVGTRVSKAASSNKPVVLVVGQVEDDQSIAKGCELVNTNASLLAQVRSNRPDAWIVYKPHPDVVAGNRKGRITESVISNNADEVELQASIIDCIERCDELHTMTSLAGFEALMRSKAVVTYGAPFYSGWGLTRDHQRVERRTRRRTLDELIYLTLIEYPRYIDLISGEFIRPEDLVKTIISQSTMNNNKGQSSWPGRQLEKATNILRGLRYAP